MSPRCIWPRRLAHLLVIAIASGRRLGFNPRLSPPRCCATTLASPPPIGGAVKFQRGVLETAGPQIMWRQDEKTCELILPLPEDISVKKDMNIGIAKHSISLSMSGKDLLNGPVPFEVDTEDSNWYLEDGGLVGISGDRFLIVNLHKKEPFVDWPSPVMDSGKEAERRLVIGGTGMTQKEHTARQLQSYQVLSKLPTTVRADAYVRAPEGRLKSEFKNGTEHMELYFIGKVAIEPYSVGEGQDTLQYEEEQSQDAAIAAQEVLLKEHSRLYQPNVFGDATDEQIEIWVAAPDSELRVAYDTEKHRKWTYPIDVSVPIAGLCGFEPETPTSEQAGRKAFFAKRDVEGLPLNKERLKLIQDNEVVEPDSPAVKNLLEKINKKQMGEDVPNDVPPEVTQALAQMKKMAKEMDVE